MTGASTIEEGYDDMDEEAGLSGFWILIIFLAVLAVFAGIITIAYQKGQHNAASELPSVGADPRPTRTEIGLDPVDDSRAEVDEELNASEPARVIAEVEPEADPLAGYETEAPSPVRATPSAQDRSAPVEAAPDPANIAAARQQPAVSSPATPSVNPAANRRPVASEPQPTPAAVTPQPAAVASAATHSVQVGAFGSRDEAMAFYGSLMKRMGPLVGNQRPEVRVATVKGREYHRLWIGAFSDQASASAFCAQLKEKGQDCLVRAR